MDWEHKVVKNAFGKAVLSSHSCDSIASVSLFPLKRLPIQNSSTLDDCLTQGHRATFKLLVQGLSRKPVPWRTISTSKVSTSAVNNELRCRVIMCYYWFFSFVRLSVMVSQSNCSRSSALWEDHMTICGTFDVPVFLHQLRMWINPWVLSLAAIRPETIIKKI